MYSVRHNFTRCLGVRCSTPSCTLLGRHGVALNTPAQLAAAGTCGTREEGGAVDCAEEEGPPALRHLGYMPVCLRTLLVHC